jgi:molybdate transport system permease protein
VAFRWTGAALAAAVMAFPLMVRAIRLSLDAADRGWKRPQARSAHRRSGSS